MSFKESEEEFSSKEAGTTIPDIDKQLKEITDKKAFIEQATEVVLSLGSKALYALMPSRTRSKGMKGQHSLPETLPSFDLRGEDGSSRAKSIEDILEKSNSFDGSSTVNAEDEIRRSASHTVTDSAADVQNQGVVENLRLPKSRRTHNRTKSWDILSSKDIDVKSTSNGDKLATPTMDVPKLLVSPKRTSKAMKSAHSTPHINETNKDRAVVDSSLEEVKKKLAELLVLWEARKTKLEEAKKAVEFLEAVPKINEWLESFGLEFFAKYDSFGRSIEEVRGRQTVSVQHTLCCYKLTS